MKKNIVETTSNANELASAEHLSTDFELFKSKVANAVLDYMEAQSDSDLIECLKRTSGFLTNISFQMEKVFDNQIEAFKDNNDLSEIGEDLFAINQQTSSDRLH